MKKTIQKALSLLLSAALVLSLGIVPAYAQGRAPAEGYDDQTDLTRVGPGESHAEAVAAPETNPDVSEPEPEDEGAAPLFSNRSSTADVPIKDSNKNSIYCRGTPVVIKEDGGQTYLYDQTGTTKLLDFAITGYTVYGGSQQENGEMGNTSVTMESGSVGSLIGGDCFSNRTGNTRVVVRGGTVTGNIYGGSLGYANETQHGYLDGNTEVILEGGTVGWVFGGGENQGTQVTGRCSVTVKNTFSQENAAICGGSSMGTVGNTSVTVEAGARVGTIYGGGYFATSSSGNTSVSISGTASVVFGGAHLGTVQDTDVTVAASGKIVRPNSDGGFLAGGGSAGSSVARNTKLTLHSWDNGYTYGGSEHGTVRNTEINIEAINNWPVRGGGQSGTSVVTGDTVINIIDSSTSGIVTGGGYYGKTAGNATVNAIMNQETGNLLSDIMGQSNEPAAGKVVAGATALNITGNPNNVRMMQLYYECLDFDDITIGNGARLEIDPGNRVDQIDFQPQNLHLEAGGFLHVGKHVVVEGDFSGGGTLEIKEGVTFSAKGTVTGVATIGPVDYEAWSGGSFKVIDGAAASLSNYTIAGDAYDLVKKADGLYAMKPNAANLTITAPTAPKYGDSISVTVKLEDPTELTESAWVKLTLTGNGDTLEKTENSFTGTTTFDLSVLAAGAYTLKAELGQPGLDGTTTQSMTVGRRPLTMDTGALAPWSRAYTKDNKDAIVPHTYFENATLSGYYGQDSGGKLGGGDYRYLLTTDTAGENKANTPGDPELRLTYYPGGSAQEEARDRHIYQNYMIPLPQIKINVTPAVISTVTFPTTGNTHWVGMPLSQRPLMGGSTDVGSFRWKDDTINPPVGTANYEVVFTPLDTVNYDYSGITGWDAATKTITQSIRVSTSKKERPIDKQYAKTSTVQSTPQTVTVDLAAATKAPEDAGTVVFTYRAEDATVGDLTDIAINGSTLSFTVPSTADANDNAASLPITVTSEYYQDFTLTVTVSLSHKTTVTISGISVAGLSELDYYVYNGTPVSYEGTPVITGGYTGALEFLWYTRDGVLLEEAPTESGHYTLVVKVPDTDATYAGRYTKNFSITLAPLTIRAEDKTIRPGDEAPVYTAVFEGLAPGEAVTVTLTCEYVKDDPANGIAGTYRIVPSNCQFTTGDMGSYRIGYTAGTLYVREPEPTPPLSTGGGGTVTKPPVIETLPDGTVIKTQVTTKTDSSTGSKVEQKTVTTTAPSGTVTKVDTITISGGRDGVTAGVTTEVNATGETAVTATVTAKEGATSVKLPAAVVKATSGDHITSMSLLSKVGGVTLTFDAKALEALKKTATTPTVSVTPAEAKTLPEAIRATAYHFTTGGKGIDFDGGTVTVSIAYEKKDGTKAVAVYFVAGDGSLTRVAGTRYQNGTVTFPQSHWSTYAIVEETALPFTDVAEGDWYYESVRYAFEHKLFSGTSTTAFGPAAPMTRAMLMTVLARLDGQDTTVGATWDEVGMRWAMEKGISDGTSPEVNVTREQLAVMLYRYVGAPAAPKLVLDFTDADKVSDWAADALRWAVDKGMIAGKGGGILDPKGKATRAEVAAVLYHYIENTTK